MKELLAQMHLVLAAGFAAVWIWHWVGRILFAKVAQGATLVGLRFIFLVVLALPGIFYGLRIGGLAHLLSSEIPLRIPLDGLPDLVLPGDVQASSLVAEVSALQPSLIPHLAAGELVNSLLLVGSLLWLVLSAAKLLRDLVRLRALSQSATLIRVIGSVRIAASDDATSPLTFWLPGASWVVVPTRLVASAADFRMSVLHELQHHRQRDVYWLWLLRLTGLLLGWSPAFLGWQRLFLTQQELACDEALLCRRGCTPREYAQFLLDQSRFVAKRMHLLSAGLVFRPSTSILERRIRSMVQISRSPSRLQTLALSFLALAVSSAMVPFAYSLERTNRDSAVPPKQQISAAMQDVLKKALLAPADAGLATAGFALVARPSDGALIGALGFVRDPVTQGISWKEVDWVLAQSFEPGSIVKPWVAAAALQENKVTASEHLDCPESVYKMGDRTYRNWKEHGQENLTIAQTVVQSGNVCNLVAARRVGLSALADLYAKLGVHEVAGLHQKDALDRAAMGIGWTTTPGAVVNAYREIVASAVGKQAGSGALTSQVSRDVVTMLEQAVKEGTGRLAKIDGVAVAGKTGTANYYADDAPSLKTPPRNTGAFVGFAPSSSPKLIGLVVLIQPPQGKLGGGALAGPVFRNIVLGSLPTL